MTSVFQKIKRSSIRKQFFVICIISCCLLLIFCLLIINALQKILLENTENYADISTKKFENEMENLYLQVEVFNKQFQSDNAYKELFTCTSYRQINSALIKDISTKSAYIKFINSSIVDISYVNNLVHWSNIYNENTLHTINEQLANNGNAYNLGIIYSTNKAYENYPYYVFGCNIYDDNQKIGAVILTIDLQKSNLMVSGEDNASNFIMIDPYSNVYSFNCTEDITDRILNVCEDTLSHFNKEMEKSRSVTAEGYAIKLTYIPDIRSYIISAVDISKINKILENIWIWIWAIFSVMVMTALIIGFSLYKNLINPLNQFNQAIIRLRKERKRHLDGPLEIEGCLEVVNLNHEFTEMFITIDSLNHKIFETSAKLYETKIRGQATEISYLKSQINPHFLYNVLELIRALAFSYNVPEISLIAVSMGKMYRYSIKGQSEVPLKDELEITKAYLEIQKLRFKDKFDVFFNFPEDTLSIPVIKMLLQPLVENAIYHGLEPMHEKGILYIGCKRIGKTLEIYVRDNGIGIAKERSAELDQFLNTGNYDTSRYVGIVNTNARIKLQYGNQYGITIESNPGDGTVVSFRIPLREMDCAPDKEDSENV